MTSDAENQTTSDDSPHSPAPKSTRIDPGYRPGHTIGHYRILSTLGEGGFGVVYLAEQTEPVKRRVALKVIKPGMDSKQVIARFEAERQALAMMDHPNVARVFDAGLTDDRRPYFVMEHVPGVSVTDHCDRQRLSIVERLHLFIQICEAVQHAHQKGIIHRDIKPSNILVSVSEGKSQVKVIDFGVAKALHQKLTDKTIFTEQGQLIGTPIYMSPEQAEMTAQDIDTRSDIYSLGVLLYELLTGALPFDPESLRKAAFAEIQRIIREEEPRKPSTRLSGLGDDSTTNAENRRLDTRSLERALRGDLDWIVMKALEKDRERRYETANGFAADIRRHLNNEPVVAGPPSAAYRMRKFVKRNRGAVVTVGVVFGVLLAGVVGTSWGMFQATAARKAETKAKEDTQTALTLAEQRAEDLQQVADFQSEQLGGVDTAAMGLSLRDGLRLKLTALNERRGLDVDAADAVLSEYDALIAGADFTGLALDTLAEHIFDPALVAIDRQFQNQPLVRAQLQQTVAETMRDAGLLERALSPQSEALRIRRRELGDEHPDTLISIDNMGVLLESQGNFVEAESYYREALEGRRKVLGNAHPVTLSSISNWGTILFLQGNLSDAEPFLREALDRSRELLGDEHPDTLNSINNMGALLVLQGKLVEAETYYGEALDGKRKVLGDYDTSTLISIASMGALLQSQGRLNEAEPYCREALIGLRNVLGDENPDTMTSINNMGVLLQSQGKLDEAEPYYREALKTKRRVLGDDHSETLASINNMGGLLYSQGKLDEAEPYFREALDAFRRVLGDEHPGTMTLINNMGTLLQDQGKLEEAEPYFREVLDTRRRVLGDDHPRTLGSIDNMGYLLESQGKLKEAEPYYREALDASRRLRGDDHPDTLMSINIMGGLLRDLGQLEKAEALGAEAVDRGRKSLAEGHWHLGVFLTAYGKTLLKLQRFEDAKEALAEALNILQAALGTNHERTIGVIKALINLYTGWHAAEPGNGYDAKAEEWRAKLDAVQPERDDESQGEDGTDSTE